MIKKTIGEIEARIQGADALGDERKRELLQLLGTLKTEIGTLSKTHDEQAESIAGFARVSAHEATRGGKIRNYSKLTQGITLVGRGFREVPSQACANRQQHQQHIVESGDLGGVASPRRPRTILKRTARQAVPTFTILPAVPILQSPP